MFHKELHLPMLPWFWPQSEIKHISFPPLSLPLMHTDTHIHTVLTCNHITNLGSFSYSSKDSHHTLCKFPLSLLNSSAVSVFSFSPFPPPYFSKNNMNSSFLIHSNSARYACHQILTSTPSYLSKYFYERNTFFFPRRNILNTICFTFDFWNNI